MNLAEFLKNNENARKIFGEREIKIIEKQIQGINLTQSEKNRLSRDIRKKLSFIKELSKLNIDFDLKKGSLVKDKIRDIQEHILESIYSRKVKKIILYGSTITKERTFRSDIDLAVEFDSITSKEATHFRIKFNYDKNIDVQVYNLLPEKIKKEIEEKGKVIWKRE